MNELALFAGAGGGLLGGKLLGWRPVCAVEYNAYARNVLLARQNDGTLPPFPIWDDVRTFDGRPWRGTVDVVSGGFPCQDISVAGKGDGLEGERSGLWSEMARIIGEVRPRLAYVENSPMLTSRGLGRVLGDLSAMGFDAEWGVLGARHTGAHHERNRIWILAHSNEIRRIQCSDDAEERGQRDYRPFWKAQEIDEGWPHGFNGTYPAGYLDDWEIPKDRGIRRTDGLAFWVERLEAIGNGQCPQVAASAFELLKT